MKILVIGGNRFFGKKLVRKLIDENHSVTLLNRQNVDDGFGSQIERIKCDRTNALALQSELKNKSFDIVYDQVCYEAKDARAACEIFADKTSHYIFTSTQSVYELGSNLAEDSFDPKSYRFSEDLSFTPGVSSKSHYAEAKRQCEAVFFDQKKFLITTVRFTFVVGEDDYTERLKWHFNRVKLDQPIYCPNIDAKFPMIHSSDAAEVLFQLGKMRKDGPFNASAPAPTTLAEVLNHIEKPLGKKAVLENFESEQSRSPYGVESDWYMSIEKLKSVGVSPRDISVWLPDLLKIYSLA